MTSPTPSNRPRGESPRTSSLKPEAAPTEKQRFAERTLHVIPESHLDRAEDDARALARSIRNSSPDRKVVLFLESIRSEHSPTPNSEDTFTTVGVGTGIINQLHFPLAFAVTAANFCRVSAVNGNPTHPRTYEVAKDAHERTRLFMALQRDFGPVTIEKIQDYLLTSSPSQPLILRIGRSSLLRS